MEHSGGLASTSNKVSFQVASSLFFWDVPRANIHAVEDIEAVVDWLLERCDFQPDAKSNKFRSHVLLP